MGLGEVAAHRTHDGIMKSSLRQNDVTTSFSCNKDVIFALCIFCLMWDEGYNLSGVTLKTKT